MPVIPGFDDTPVLSNPLRPCGTSPVSRADFIENIIGETADVIGQSFGGWAAPWLALDRPDAVGLLVLECPAGFRPVPGIPPPSSEPELRLKQMFAHTRSGARPKPGPRRRWRGTGRCCTAITGRRPVTTP